jgi:hypothetical protein
MEHSAGGAMGLIEKIHETIGYWAWCLASYITSWQRYNEADAGIQAALTAQQYNMVGHAVRVILYAHYFEGPLRRHCGNEGTCIPLGEWPFERDDQLVFDGGGLTLAGRSDFLSPNWMINFVAELVRTRRLEVLVRIANTIEESTEKYEKRRMKALVRSALASLGFSKP